MQYVFDELKEVENELLTNIFRFEDRDFKNIGKKIRFIKHVKSHVIEYMENKVEQFELMLKLKKNENNEFDWLIAKLRVELLSHFQTGDYENDSFWVLLRYLHYGFHTGKRAEHKIWNNLLKSAVGWNMKLFNYQKEIVNKIIEKKTHALFLKMGLGKTSICLHAISKLLTLNKIKKVLILAPVNIVKNVWLAELKKWKSIQNIKIVNVLGTKKQRERLLESNANVFVISNNLTQWVLNEPFNYDMLIIDESTAFKSYSSLKFKALKQKLHTFEYRIILSGTPLVNNYIDLWSQIYILDLGESLGKNITSYKNEYFIQNPYCRFILEINKLKVPILHQKIAHLATSLVDNINMKNKLIFKDILLDFDKETELVYKTLKKHNIVKIGKKELIAESAITLINKLMQISNGFVYHDDKKVISLNDNKVKALLKLILSNDDNFIIVYNYTHEKVILKKALGSKLHFLTSSNIKKWNNNEIKYFALHSKSASQGLNLQKGGFKMVWYSIPFSLENYLQMNARLYRTGQNRDVIIYRILMNKSIDIVIAKALSDKKFDLDTLLNYLKTPKKLIRTP